MLQPKDDASKQDEGYRSYYLKSDITRAKLSLMFFILPMVGFVFNDYAFFGWTQEFFGLVALRAVLTLILVATAFFIDRIKTYQGYDRMLFLSVLVLAIGGGVINSLRPQDFLVQALLTIIAVFIIFLIAPFRFFYQCLIAFGASIGEAIIIVFITKPLESPVLFSVLFGLLITNMIAATAAYQLHSYRRKAYSEYLTSKKVQKELEDYSKHLEDIVEARTQELRVAERFAAIGATAGMVGHDLRNPLMGISNAVYYLKKKYGEKLDPTGEDMLHIIAENVEYSNKIVNDLLDYSGNIVLDLSSMTTPKALVTQSLSMIDVPANIKVDNLTEDTPKITVDEAKMKRVFINILKNAVDAMPDGGALVIKSNVNAGKIRISISDTGPGISEENQKKLFQPLYTTKAKGMGFGLPICQRIVAAHKGKIEVKSIPGHGATFIVELSLLSTE
ncbi:MAG: two-component system sensor histidine kinase NtrB [Candidatus Bathyarchaeia archaeon]